MSFNGKVVLVTGGSSGIGAAIAIKFAEEGAKVAIVGRNQEKLNNVANKCGKPLVLVADVTKDDDVRRIVNETVKHFGKLDVLVNNAGIALQSNILSEDTMKVFDQVTSTNLRSVVFLTHLCAPYLIKTKGNIVNISSIAGLYVFSTAHTTYCTSKAALDHFTRSVAAELAPKGVRVNSVNPGPVKTDILENSGVVSKEHAEAAYENMNKMTPLGRISEAEEIADLVLFVASDKAKAITGSIYVTDNGFMFSHAIPKS